ncbi:DNA ligase D [Erythrobacter aureus]|uniref:DNA ligase D n=1 Tax=Erythrobacter aureus TaxID=2182384 RepID=UPI003A93AE4D
MSSPALSEYNAKRDFAKTPEPTGKPTYSPGGNLFIVQKHDATRLHWDLRLEVDGVLKSWAVTKGPSPDPDVKRLAVKTEDHPLSYAEFEGVIPQGEYGGGTVMLWDRGTWAPIEGKSADDLKDGHLHFTLQGERMKGEWLLVRLKPRGKEKRENWLLRKLHDEHARPGDALVERELTSVLTGRSMAEIAAIRSGDASSSRANRVERNKTDLTGKASKTNPRQTRKKAALPNFRKPQLATSADDVPTGNRWMHEIKFDGYRAMIAASGDEVKIYTRNGKNWTAKFGPLVEAIKALALPACLIDGEIVAYDANGNPNFSILQQVLKRGLGSQSECDDLALHAFDLIELNGEDLSSLPNIERKEGLEALLANSQPPIHVADHVFGAGEELLKAMCGAGQEGIIAKRLDAPYRHARTKAWLKVKCIRREEFIIVGWKHSTSKGRPFASLLLAQKEGDNLIYKGNVGTGFTLDEMERLATKLHRLKRKTSPLEVDESRSRAVTWVSPKLIAEIAFAEFTAGGNIRHGSFIGLRENKKSKSGKSEKSTHRTDTESPVNISSRDRVIFPDSGQTKGNLADYYAAIAPAMLPFASRRPISLVRCPRGRAKECFFQKHDSGSFGDAVHQVPISEKDGGVEDYLYLENAKSVLQCVQMGTIEFHGWGALSDAVELPDRMVFDLDPDERIDFGEVKLAAMEIRRQLADLGLISFAMLSGGKGVHVIVPLSPGHSWDAHKDFSKRFAMAMSMSQPERFVATASKVKRKGKIFIDWLRNQRGSTAILPYSARARSGAPVAVPISWHELEEAKNAQLFSINAADSLLSRATGKALVGWGFADQELPDM